MSTELTVPEKLGPAMAALNPRQRGFVIAFCTMAEPDATNAARAAGYVDNGKTGIRVLGHRLLHSENVRQAILEFARNMVGTEGLMVGLQAIMAVARNPQAKDHAKAALALMNRGGLHEVVERHNTHHIILTEQEKVEEIKQLAQFLGQDPSKFLGTTTIDADFHEVPPGLEGLEDLL